MQPLVVIVGLAILVGAGAGIPAWTILKLARLKAAQGAAPPNDMTARLETVEQHVEHLQQELSETQERLDFAERLLSQARAERRIGP